MYRPVLKLLIIQQFALLLKSIFVILSTFLIYGQSCNGHQKLIFSFLYKLPLIVDESHSNFFALPNLLYMRFRLTIEPFSEFVCFLQRLFSTCLMGVLCDLKLSTKGRTIAKLKFHFASTIGTEHGHSTLELAYSRCLQNAYFSQMRDSE